MPAESFSGTWTFDPSTSELNSPPSQWRQTIQIEGDRVQEQITREIEHSTVETLSRFTSFSFLFRGAFSWKRG
jgi:hypothetical protein